MSAHFYANLHHIYNHSKIIESLTCKKLICDPNINNVMLCRSCTPINPYRVPTHLLILKLIALGWSVGSSFVAASLTWDLWLPLTSQHIPFRKLQYIFPNVDKVFLNVVLLKADCNILASGECHSQLCRRFATFSSLLQGISSIWKMKIQDYNFD